MGVSIMPAPRKEYHKTSESYRDYATIRGRMQVYCNNVTVKQDEEYFRNKIEIDNMKMIKEDGNW